jgi:outer membrane biosynthesis protein TonB
MIKEKKNRLAAILGTILFHIGVLMLFIFLALRTPLPLPGEQGVIVNLGYDETGMGMDQAEQPAPTADKPLPPAPRQVQEEEDYLVQDIDEAPAITKKKTEEKRTEPEKVISEPEPVKEPVKAEPEPEPALKPDPKALYKGKGNSTQGGQEGQTGQPGDQGDPTGTPGANIYNGKSGSGEGTGEGSGSGTGPGDGSGEGISYKLEGRGSLSLFKPAYDSREQGKVVVTIKVDRKGNVISAVSGAKGTNVSDQTLWQLAKDAAIKSKFQSDANAPEVQVGSITYNFIRQN